jgi:hypothetical protein
MATRKRSAAKPKAASAGARNEGEGNKTAARHYNEAQHKFAASGKVSAAARAARKALEGSEGATLRRAEAVGMSKARSAVRNGPMAKARAKGRR